MSIQFSGLGSGIDTSSWVDGLVALKQAKVTTLEESKKATQTIQETLSSIRSFFSTFRSTLERFTDAKFGGSMDLFIQNSAKSMNAAVVTATATSEAARQSYDVLVEKLATATKAESGRTTLDNATNSTKLSQLGMRDGTILINGQSISVKGSDTIADFVTKINNAGINAYFDENKAKLNIDTTFSKISQGITKFTEAFKLNASNVGYSNAINLTTTIKKTQETIATNDTFLSKLGVTSGKVNVTTNGSSYDVYIDANTTKVGDLAGKLGVNAWLDSNGSYTIENAVLKSVDGGSNLISAFGLQSSVYSQTQVSTNLNATNTVVKNPLGSTTLTTLGVTAGNLSVTAGGETTNYTITADTTITSFVNDMNALGASAAYDESTGNLTVDGATFKALSGGSNLLSVFDFSTEIYSSSLKTEAMTETLTTSTNVVATGATELKDLGLIGNYSYDIYDKDGNKVCATKSITGVGTTISSLLSTINSAGSASGITATINDGVVKIDGGYIVCEDITNALKLSTISAGTAIEGSQTFETIVAAATESSTLTQLGIGDSTYTLKAADGTTIASNVVVNGSTTLGVLASNLSMNGVTAKVEDGKLVMEGGYIEGALATALEMSTTSSSTNSDKTGGIVTYNKVTVAIGSNTLANIGVTEDKTYSIYDDNGDAIVTGLTATSGMTLDQLVSTINTRGNAKGVSASFDVTTGSITIEGGSITGELADALGITTSSVNVASQVSGTNLTYNVTNDATGTTTLADLNYGDLTYTLTDDSGNVVVSNGIITSSTSLSDIATALSQGGIEVKFDAEKSAFTVSGGKVSGALATALGLKDTGVAGNSTNTGSAVRYESTTFASGSTTLADLGYGNLTYVAYDSNGQSLTNETKTISSSSSINDIVSTLNGHGLNASFDETTHKISIEGGYITGTLADTLGLTATDYDVDSSKTGTAHTYTTTVTASGATTLAQLNKTGNYGFTVYDANGTTVKTGSISSGESLSTIATTLTGNGVTVSYDETTGKFSVAGGSVSGDLANILGLNTTSTDSDSTITGSAQTYATTLTATEDTTIGQLFDITTGKTFTIWSTDGTSCVGTTFASDTTLNTIFNWVDANSDGSATINSTGVIQISDAYATGELAQLLGLNSTGTFATSETTGTKLTYDTTVNASSSTTLADISNKSISASQTYTVYNTEGVSVGSGTVTTDTSLTDMCSALSVGGVTVAYDEATGKITVEGGRISGNLATALGLGATDTDYNSSKSSAQLSYSKTYDATGTTTLSDMGIANSAYTLYNENGISIDSGTITAGTSITDMCSALTGNGVTVSFDSSTGKVSVTGGRIEGALATALGLTSSGTGTNSSAQMSNALTYTTYFQVNNDTKLSDLGITSEKTYTVYDANGTSLGSFTAQTSDSLAAITSQISSALTSGGDRSGSATVNSTNGTIDITGGYIGGDLADALGMTTSSNYSTYSYQGGTLTYNDSFYANANTTMADLGKNGDYTYTVYDSNGTVILDNQTLTAGETIGTAISKINNALKTSGDRVGACSIDSSTGEITIEGGYIRGTLADALGIDVESGDTDYSYTSNSLKYTKSNYANSDTTLLQLGKSGNYTYTVYDSNGTVLLNNQTLSQGQSLGTAISAINTALSTSGDTIGSCSIDSYGNITINGGYITGTLSDTLGLTTSSSNTTYTYNKTNLSYDMQTTASSETFLENIGITSTLSYDLYDEDGTFLFASSFASPSTTSIGDVIGTINAQLKNYGDRYGTASFVDGKIQIDGGYIAGDLATALGMTNSSDTDYSYTSGMLSYEIETTAGSTTLFSELGVTGSCSMSLYSSSGDYAGQITVNENDEFGTIVNKIINQGQSAGITVSGSAPEGMTISGGYVDGELAEILGFSTVTTTQTYTTKAQSNSLYVTTSSIAGINTTLAELGIDSNKTLSVYSTDGTLLFTSTYSSNKTIEEVLHSVNRVPVCVDKGANASFTYGTISMFNCYVEGDLAEALGFTTEGGDVSYEDRWTSNTSGVIYTSTGSVASTSTSIGNTYIAASGNTTYSVFTADGTQFYTDSFLFSTSVGEMVETLNTVLGHIGGSVTFEDGKITVEGGYIVGALADAIGLDSETYNTTKTFYTTAPITCNSSLLKVESLTAASSGTTLQDLGIPYSSAITGPFEIYSADGTKVWTAEYDTSTTLGNVVNLINSKLSQYGGSAELRNGVVTINNGYIYGSFANHLGMRNTTTEVTTYDTCSNGIIEFTRTEKVYGSTSLVNMGLSVGSKLTGSYGSTVLDYKITSSTTVNDVLSYLSEASDSGIIAAMSGNKIVISSEESVTLSGAVATKLGLTGSWSSNTQTTGATSESLIDNETYAINGTTKLVDLGLSTGTGGLNFVYNGNTYFNFSVYSNTTVNDVIAYLNQKSNNGVSGTVGSGSISLTADRSVSLSGVIAERLGLNDSWDSSTSTGGQVTQNSLTYNTNEDVLSNTYLVRDLGLSVGDKMNCTYNGASQTAFSVTENMTVADVLSYLSGVSSGVTASMSGNKIVISSEETMSLSGAVATKLGLTGGWSSTETTDYQRTEQLTYTDSLNVEESTKLVDMGVSVGSKLSGSYGGAAFTDFVVSSNTTVGQALAHLESVSGGGVTTRFSGNSISMTANDTLTLDGAVAEALGIDGTSGSGGAGGSAGWTSTTYTSAQSGTNFNSSTAGIKLNADTTLKDLGFTGTQTLSGTIDGVALQTGYFTEDTKISTVMNWLNSSNGSGKISATLSDGKISASATGQVVISSSGGDLADVLGIDGSWSTGESYTNSQISNKLQYTDAGNVSGNTTLEQLGLSGSQTFSYILDGGNTISATFGADTKVSEVLAWLNSSSSNKISAAIGASNGIITATADGEVVVSSGDLANKLGLSGTWTKDGGNTSSQSSGVLQQVNTAVVEEEATLASLGITSGLTLSGTIDGVALQTKTFSSSNHITEVLNYFTSQGISATIEDGKIVTSANGAVVISDSNLATKLGIAGTWATETINNGQVSGALTYQGTTELKGSTKLSELGFSNGGTLGGTVDGVALSGQSFTGNSTVQDVLDWLNSTCGSNKITAKLENGKIIASADGTVALSNTGLAQYFGIAGNWNISDTDVSAQEGVLLNKVTNHNLSDTSTKLSDLGFTNGGTLGGTFDGSVMQSKDFTGDSTVQDVLDWLNSVQGDKINATIQDGKIVATADGAVVISSTNLANTLGLSGTWASASTVSAQTGQLLQSFNNVTLNNDNKGTITLADIGLASGGSLAGTIDGVALKSQSFSGSDTIQSVLDYFNTQGISATVQDGKIVTSAEGIVIMSDTGLASKFGLSGAWASTTNTSTQEGSSLSVTQTDLTLSETTTLGDLGLNSGNIGGTINGQSISGGSFTKDSTVGEVLNYLKSNGIDAKIEDGKVVASANADVDIYSTDLAEKLGIAKDWSKTESVASQQSAAQVYSQSGLKLTEDTLLSDLGYTSATLGGTIDGVSITPLQLTGDSKMSDVLDYLRSYGIEASIDSQGRLVASANKEVRISNTSLANRLGIAGDWNYTSNNDASVSKNLTVTTVDAFAVTGSTKLKDINGVDSYEFNITVDGVASTVSLNGDNTVSDVMNALKSAGVESVTISNGVIAAASSKDIVISPTSATGTNIITKLGLAGDWQSTGCVQSSTENLTKVNENTSTVGITENTLLSSIGNVTAGSIYLTVDGVRHTIEIDETGTVGDFLEQLKTYGISASVNKHGAIEIYHSGDVSFGTPTSDATNILSILGLNTSFEKLYNNTADLSENVEETVAIDRNTVLTDLGVTNTTLKYQDGNSIKSIILSSDETVGSLMDKLVEKGFSTAIGSDGKLTVYAEKDMYLLDDTTSDTDVMSILGITEPVTSNNYNSTLIVKEEVDEIVLASNDTKLVDGMGVTAGTVGLSIDGVRTDISVTADDTIGSLVQKINDAGLEVSAAYDEATGKMTILSTGASSFVMENGTSNLMTKLGLDSSEFGSKLVSSSAVQGNIAKTVSGVVDANTVLSTMGVKDGTISLYVDGVKNTVEIDSTKTLGELMNELISPYGADVTWRIDEEGKMEIKSASEKQLQLGTSADKSNFADIIAIKTQADGSLLGLRSLFKANTAAKLTSSEAGFIENITAGTFTIGEAEFTIDENTTLDSLINQINTSEEARASVYWDSVSAKLVITSKDTGAAYINIEKGDSNFTDVMGFTNGTQMLTDKQTLGENAEFSINGTKMTSASNTITSDVSKIKGLTFNLKGVSENNQPTKVVVSQDSDTLTTVVKDFVKGYNNLMTNLEKELGMEGGLNDETTLRMIRNELRTLITGTDAGTTVFKNLDAIGITTGKATDTLSTDMYTLQIDEEKFLDVLSKNATAVKELLIGGDSNQGVLTKVAKVVNNSLDAVSGYFATRNKSLDLTLQRIDNNIERQKTAVEKYRAQLENKFQLMDKMIASMQNQYSSFLG